MGPILLGSICLSIPQQEGPLGSGAWTGCICRLAVLDSSLEANGPFVSPARANGPGRRNCELPQGLKGRPF